MTDLIDTTEMYLRTILDLEEEGITPLRARISERLGHSGPTVSQTIARMERDGLVEVAPDRRLVLSEQGREKATRVMRKHRIAESLLANVIGLDLSQVHDEACRWEHVMSDEAEERIFDLLGQPTHSPYGTPIPTAEDDGRQMSTDFLDGVQALSEVGADAGPQLVRRLGEPVQADLDLLAMLHGGGVFPGASVTVENAGERFIVTVVGRNAGVIIPVEAARHIYVAK
ncbi:metal-dependent transcriptional regulator [Gulosibacter molinativorax]|uniref:Metal-dependent transcriptional regulator n=1 Tax=Gulosibacter molinativorax TaxID=256821 RepID=A0ABT7CBN1_9MICO|nr:metal-dependent transcriptional regulator [Gulosibacter molinativorax]MDJ1372046.1 metal-dependent transcriptional regulator [Gulosibacter molinativorax]QUY63905.1 Iron-dependent repressor IdeR [Gulosibacter molinativorax]